ncbi:MAG: hypothetical protein IKF17_05275 [Clostridia bacterium]|nr:hypothetical protein [Clostridia bacterium]
MLKLKKVNIFDVLYIMIGCPWLFYMIMTSRSHTVIKTILLFSLVMICVTEIIIKKKALFKRDYFIYTAFFIIYFSVSLMHGIISGYEFSLKNDFALIQYFIITPICITIISYTMNLEKKRSFFIWRYLEYLTVVLVFLDLFSILLYKKGVSIPILDFIKISSNHTTDELSLRVSNEVSLMFLLPIYLYMAFQMDKLMIKDKIVIIIIISIGCIYVLLSGRKITELILLTEIVYIFFSKIHNRKIVVKKIFINLISGVIILVSLFYILNYVSNSLNIEDIFNKATSTLRNGISKNHIGVVKRNNNLIALFNLWLQSPIWGNGLNSYAIESLASSKTFWSYEIIYNALLAQTGIIGVTIFAIGCVYILKKLLKKYKKSNNEKYMAVFLGFLSFVLCGATNPLVYIMWPWIVSLIISDEELEISEK